MESKEVKPNKEAEGAMNTYMESGDIAPLILNLSTSWK